MKSAALVLLLGLAACSRHGGRAAVAPAPARDTSIAEVTVAQLPRGFIPPRASMPARPLDPTPPPGIMFDMKASPPRISGVRDTEATFEVDLRDPHDAVAAYCLAPEEVDVPDVFPKAADRQFPGTTSVKIRLPWFAVPLTQPEVAVRAERVIPGTPPRYEMLSMWATEAGNSKLTAQNSIPLRLIGGLAGVEVFAFHDATQKPQPTVSFIVRRPPLTKGLARYASFLVSTTTHGTTAGSCMHARVELPVTRGGGDTAQLDVAVETAGGVRRMMVHVGTLWLPEEPSARVSARLGWAGREVERLALEDPDDDSGGQRREERRGRD